MSSSLTSATNAVAARGLDYPDLAIIGKAGAGKTTLASAITGPLGLSYTKLAFADKLKAIAVELWGEEVLLDRGRMQDFGVAMREIDPDVWCRALGHRLLDVPLAVIDDCRFPNEYEALKAEGFVFIRVEAPESVRIDRLKGIGKFQTEEQLHHISETALDHIEPDYVIDTSGPTPLAPVELQSIINRERSKR